MFAGVLLVLMGLYLGFRNNGSDLVMGMILIGSGLLILFVDTETLKNEDNPKFPTVSS
jgi:multisubunit Na+/H+ antiporter MnhC subunit